MKFNGNSNVFIHENALESVVCETAAILSRPQCVKVIYIGYWSRPGSLLHEIFIHFLWWPQFVKAVHTLTWLQASTPDISKQCHTAALGVEQSLLLFWKGHWHRFFPIITTSGFENMLHKLSCHYWFTWQMYINYSEGHYAEKSLK